MKYERGQTVWAIEYKLTGITVMRGVIKHTLFVKHNEPEQRYLVHFDNESLVVGESKLFDHEPNLNYSGRLVLEYYNNTTKVFWVNDDLMLDGVIVKHTIATLLTIYLINNPEHKFLDFPESRLYVKWDLTKEDDLVLRDLLKEYLNVSSE